MTDGPDIFSQWSRAMLFVAIAAFFAVLFLWPQV
jgi:hypothetical protein